MIRIRVHSPPRPSEVLAFLYISFTAGMLVGIVVATTVSR